MLATSSVKTLPPPFSMATPAKRRRPDPDSVVDGVPTHRHTKEVGHMVEPTDVRKEMDGVTQHSDPRQVGHLMEPSDIINEVDDVTQCEDVREVGQQLDTGDVSSTCSGAMLTFDRSDKKSENSVGGGEVGDATHGRDLREIEHLLEPSGVSGVRSGVGDDRDLREIEHLLEPSGVSGVRSGVGDDRDLREKEHPLEPSEVSGVRSGVGDDRDLREKEHPLEPSEVSGVGDDRHLREIEHPLEPSEVSGVGDDRHLREIEHPLEPSEVSGVGDDRHLRETEHPLEPSEVSGVGDDRNLREKEHPLEPSEVSGVGDDRNLREIEHPLEPSEVSGVGDDRHLREIEHPLEPSEVSGVGDDRDLREIEHPLEPSEVSGVGDDRNLREKEHPLEPSEVSGVDDVTQGRNMREVEYPLEPSEVSGVQSGVQSGVGDGRNLREIEHPLEPSEVSGVGDDRHLREIEHPLEPSEVSGVGDDRHLREIEHPLEPSEVSGVQSGAIFGWGDTDSFFEVESPDSSEDDDNTQCRNVTEAGPVVDQGGASREVNDAIERRDWKEVGHLLEHRQLRVEQRRQVREDASRHADEQDLISLIFPALSEDEVYFTVNMLYTRRLWSAVAKLLDRNDDTLNTHILYETSQFGDVRVFSECILPKCRIFQVDTLMAHLVTTREWWLVVMLLDTVDEKLVWTVGDIQLDSPLVRAVAQNQIGMSLGYLLEGDLSDSQRRWVIDVACRTDADWAIAEKILPHCADDHLEDVLSTLVKRGLWESVDKVLYRGVSPATHRRVTHEALQQAHDHIVRDNILHHFAEDQLDDVFSTLMAQGLWDTVDRLFEDCVSSETRKRMIHKACNCRYTYDWIVVCNILPHCPDDQLHEVLTTLVTRGMWAAVGTVLDRCVSPAKHRWVVQKACQEANDRAITDYILPHCTDDQLDDVLTTLVTRGLWQSAGRAVGRGVTSAKHRWAIAEALQSLSDEDVTRQILPHCADSELETVLTTLVTRALWRSVDRVLHRVVSPVQHRWAIQEACQRAADQDIALYILPHCAEGQLDDVLVTLVTRGLWWSASSALERGVGRSHHRWALQEVLKSGNDSFIAGCMLPECRPRGFWSKYLNVWHGKDQLAEKLFRFISDELCAWATAEDITESGDAQFWRYVVNPQYEMKDLTKLSMALRPLRKQAGVRLSHALDFDPALCSVLCETVVHFVTEAWVSGRQHDTQRPAGQLDEEARLLTTQIQEQMLEGQSRSTPHFLQRLNATRNLCRADTADTDRRSPVFGLYFIKNLVRLCYNKRHCSVSIDVILYVLACVPVVPGVQSVALTVMLRHKRWDVIRRADLCGVWEQVRRRLLTAACKHRQWSLVAQWANHTLYDDQCLAALEEAYTHKQWSVYLLLADHGPMELDLMRVHYRLTRYAPWDVVLEMFERGADLIECQEGVRPGKNLRILDQEKDDNERRPRYVKLLLLQEEWEERMEELGSLEAALEKQEWSVALHEINRRHRREEIVLALRAALTSKVWHVVIYLIRQGIDTRLCDRLFSLMVEIQQWDVCRVLLEEGVDLQLGLDALPQLMEQNQWTLVARLMEYDVGDALRRQVMQQALDRREGSVVWQCIINMEHDHLSVEERLELFHEAFNRENWQAVKPLVEVKDDTGIQHRDAALLESIEQHQWDVVDHCLLFRANINMLDEDGHTPMHRMAKKKDWEAVEELTKRRGDPNMLDKEGLSVFHRVIWARQWELAKLVIEYHGDIHQRAENIHLNKRTPLEMLIEARQMEVIQHTFMWCPDQGKGVNFVGETTLHAACLTGVETMLYNLLARRVDPRAVTRRGHSALSYAVICKDGPQQTVAECIRFGFSTHQPHLIDRKEYTDHGNVYDSITTLHSSRLGLFVSSLLLSPLLLAVMRGLPEVTRMLYESGACSYRVLFRLQALLADLALFMPWQKATLQYQFEDALDCVYTFKDTTRNLYLHQGRGRRADIPEEADQECLQQCAQYVIEVSTTPHSLQCMCRHVISHCLRLHKTRAINANKLPLAASMKRYVMFCDLTDPDYGRDDMYRLRRDEFVSRHLFEALSFLADGDGPGVDTDEGPQVDTGTQWEGEEGGGPGLETDKGPQVDTGTQWEEEEEEEEGLIGDSDEDETEIDSDDYSYNIYDSEVESD